MTISLNQFAPNEPVAGLYVYQANLPQLHNPIISASQTNALTYGSVVTLDKRANNTNAPVVVAANLDQPIFGVIVFSPIKSQFKAGDRVALARTNDIIWMPATGGIIMGKDLYLASEDGIHYQVTATPTAGNSIIGKAITSAAAQGDYVQVELNFRTTSSSSSQSQ